MKESTAKSLAAAVMVLIMTVTFMPAETFAKSAKVKTPARVKITSLKMDKNTLTVKWKKAKHAKKYQIYRKKKGGKWKKVKTVNSSKRKYSMKSDKEAVFSFKVRAINGKKKGKFSEVWKTTRLYSKEKRSLIEIYPDYNEYPEYYDLICEYINLFAGGKLDTTVMKAGETGLNNCHCGSCNLRKGYLKDISGGKAWNNKKNGCDMNLYYMLYDINGDGVKEIIFADKRYAEVYSIWTTDDNTPHHLISSQYRRFVAVLKNGNLVEGLGGGDACISYAFYTINNGTLLQLTELFFDETCDQEDYNYSQDETAITRDEFNQAFYTHCGESFNYQFESKDYVNNAIPFNKGGWRKIRY